MKKIIYFLILSLIVVSCATAPPKYSQSDISSATTRANQLALYEGLQAELAVTGKGANADSYRQLISDLGRKMAREETVLIWEKATRSELSSGHIPFGVMNEAEVSAEPIRTWNRASYDKLVDDLRQHRIATEGALIEEQALLASLTGDSDLVPRVETMSRIRELYGDNQEADAVYKAAYEQAHKQLRFLGDQAQRSGDYQAALWQYQSLKRLDPAYSGIDELIATSRTGIESSDFRGLLAAGDIESAYLVFTNLARRNLTPTQKREFVGPAKNLADYYSNNATNMVGERRYPEAYDMILREIAVRQWIGESSQIKNSTIAEFCEAMFDLSTASGAANYTGLKYGYLLLVHEFDPNYFSLETELWDTRETVYDNAIRRIGSVMIHSSDPTDQQIASQIAAGVREYLMENIPVDVKIVERDKLDDVKRERAMTDKLDEAYKELESADYLIEGELLTAEVESQIIIVRDRKRVITGHEEVSNPAFDDWVKEKGIRKADHPDAPSRTITIQKEEDVELTIEEHRKFGEVSVTYRVIDSQTSEHIHSETISHNLKVSDQAQEGVRYGDFVQEAKLPDLPTNIEIYNDLVDQVVDEMATDLIAFLANPEGDYFENCKQLFRNNEPIEAAEQCANAAVLREYKDQNNAEVVVWLKRVTLESGMRRD